MRKIQFRGKSLYSGKWAYGDLFHTDGKIAICPDDDIKWMDGSELESNKWCWIAPDSIGQFSGLLDKNQKPIYEGDIVRCQDSMGYSFVSPIEFREGKFCMKTKYSNCITFSNKGRYNDGKCSFEYNIEHEVLGNVHDNPELLQ